MSKIREEDVVEYVEGHIQEFHENRVRKLQELKLVHVLKRKNPYLFKAKNIQTPEMLVRSILDAYLSSQEEGIFGAFLEQLAIFVCSSVYGGRKSTTEGIDLEFERDGVRYIVVIKSGPNWGNSGQIKNMRADFRKAQKVARTNRSERVDIQAVNGCCYGRDDSPDKGDYLKLCGQRFWALIAGDDNLYIDIIEPLGFRAKERNAAFLEAYSKVITRFSMEFCELFCNADGSIRWDEVVKLASAQKAGPTT